MQTKLIDLLDVDTTTTTPKACSQSTDTENTSFKSTRRIKINLNSETSIPTYSPSINSNNINGSNNNTGLNSFLKIPFKTNGNGSACIGINVEEYCRRSILKEAENCQKTCKSNDDLEILSHINGKEKKPEPLSETLLDIAVRNSDYNTLINELKKTDSLSAETELKTTSKRMTRRNSENTNKLKKMNTSEETLQTSTKIIVKTRRKAALLQQQVEVEGTDKSKSEEVSLKTVLPPKQSLPRKSKIKEPQSPKEIKVTAAKKAKLTQSTLSFPVVKTKNNPKNNNDITTTATSAANAGGLNTFACLRNLGSTCYINCIIQVMRYTPGFVASIHRLNKQIDYLESLNIDLENEITSNNNAKFVKNLHQLLVEMADKEKQDRRPIYSPVKFVKTVWTLLSFWSNGSQQDAHEFLQYTIHFINECDLFIRKLQQQHQIKTMYMCANIEDCSKTPAQPSPAAQTPPTSRLTKNSLKAAIPKPTTSASVQENTENIVISGEISVNKEEQQPDVNSSSSVVILNHQLSARLIKSMPQQPNKTNSPTLTTTKTAYQIITETAVKSNFLRTPTKGGASANNSANNMSVKSAQQAITATTTTTKVKIETPQSMKKVAEDLYSFEDEIENSNISIFKAVRHSKALSPEDERAKAIANLYDFDLNESLDKNCQDRSLVDEKDLVSKRLKETILQNEQFSKTTTKSASRRSMPSTDFEYKQENTKKIKRENNVATKPESFLNDSMNSMIIIDSENDEDVNNYHKQNFHVSPHMSPRKTAPASPGRLRVKRKFKAAPRSPSVNVSTKMNEVEMISCRKLSIYIENLDLKKILRENDSLKIAGYALKDLDTKCGVENAVQDVVTTANAPASQTDPAPVVAERAVKKLRSKSKTFPLPVVHSQPPAPSKDIDFASSLNNGGFVDLNAITVLNPVYKPVNVMNNNGILSTNPITNFRSKLRSTASSSHRSVDTGPSLSICSALPPSPAELLRKYSASNGYTCEMDKLFKGSSVTVTQCLECENLRKCPEAFYDRSIPIDTNDDLVDESDQTDWISKCLINESYLNENSKYMCDKCQSKQEAKIHTQYTQMPNILILHLLSYGITSSIDGNLNAQKLSNRSRLVNYFNYTSTRDTQLLSSRTMVHPKHDWMKSPIASKIKMNQSLSNKNHFKLYAVVMHSGTTLNSGHYTAFVNYKIISQACTSYSNEFSSLLGNSSASNFTTQRNECSCFIDTKKNLNSNCTNPATPLSTASSTPTRDLSVANSPLKESSQEISNSDLDPQWLHFDDTKVKLLNNLEFHRKIVDSSFDSPYILFYVKE